MTNPSSFLRLLLCLLQTPHRLRRRSFATWTPDQELTQVRERSGADMKRRLEWYDLVALGVGGMLGAGVFVTTGYVARCVSGPAVFVSYAVAGAAALLSSMCYAEFAVEVPVAGGAFSYLRVTFGEFVGFFGGANLLMEYVLSNAAVARSFTEYLISAVGKNDPSSWRLEVGGLPEGYNRLDLAAVALILFLTFFLCLGTKESSVLNLVMTAFHVLFFGFVVVAGFSNGSPRNLVRPDGLLPFGGRGVLDGAAIVYFSYIGYDSVSTVAEEIRDPARSLPVGITGSVLVVTAMYCLMALALSSMFPYDQIPAKASFASAFQKTIGWRWAGNIVGAGASLGIVASLLVAMLGQARYLCVIGRARLAPLWLAKVHSTTGTPMNATIFLGICTASIAMFMDLERVLDMISIGTLIVYYMVANALVYRRYAMSRDGLSGGGQRRPIPTLVYLLAFTCASAGFALSWKLKDPRRRWSGMGLFGAACVLFTVCFHRVVAPTQPQQRPERWSVPMMPWPAAASIFMNVFLMTSLQSKAFLRFGAWSLLVVVFYVVYGVHSTYRAEEDIGAAAVVRRVADHPSLPMEQTKIDV